MTLSWKRLQEEHLGRNFFECLEKYADNYNVDTAPFYESDTELIALNISEEKDKLNRAFNESTGLERLNGIDLIIEDIENDIFGDTNGINPSVILEAGDNTWMVIPAKSLTAKYPNINTGDLETIPQMVFDILGSRQKKQNAAEANDTITGGPNGAGN